MQDYAKQGSNSYYGKWKRHDFNDDQKNNWKSRNLQISHSCIIAVKQYGNQASWTNDESIVETRPHLHFLELLGLLVDVRHSNLKLSIMLFKTRKSMFLSLPQISHKFPSAFIVQIYGWQLY